MDEVITPEALPDAPHVSAPDGEGADQTGSIPLSTLKEILGKDFKDVDGALKSIKDTYSYVGSQAEYREKIGKLSTALNTDEQGALSTIEKLMEDINQGDVKPEAAVVPEMAQPSGDYITREEAFFEKNPDIADLQSTLNRLKNSGDDTKAMSWDAFVASDLAKTVIEPVRAYREVQSQKSVLDASPRLGAAVDKSSQAAQLMEESMKARAAGDSFTANRAENQARQHAVDSVIDAFLR